VRFPYGPWTPDEEAETGLVVRATDGEGQTIKT
jgi:hypothetical protein